MPRATRALIEVTECFSKLINYERQAYVTQSQGTELCTSDFNKLVLGSSTRGRRGPLPWRRLSPAFLEGEGSRG